VEIDGRFLLLYNNGFYEISEDGDDRLSDYGDVVADGSMSSERAVYEILTAEGFSVPPPQHADGVQWLHALVGLHAEASFFNKRTVELGFSAKNLGGGNVMDYIRPKLVKSLGDACAVIGRMQDNAIQSPKLVREVRAERTWAKPVIEDVRKYLEREKLWGMGMGVSTRYEWRTRGQKPVDGARLVLYMEGSPLAEVLTHASGDARLIARVER
jgi:hypothetical protein